MKISITNRNCDFDKHYLIEESADSSIEIEIEFERIVTVQSKKSIQDSVTRNILTQLKNYKWLIIGKSQIEMHWFIDSVEKQETDKIGDLDNITKPILDALIGKNGILIDDSQINSIHTTWTTKNALRKDNVVRLIIYFNNDYTVMKENLYFLQTSKVVYSPLNFDINNKEELKGIKLFIEAFKMKRVFSEKFKSQSGVNVKQYLVRSEYEFHRTRLNGFDKSQIIIDTEFDELCTKNGIDLSNIEDELKKVSS
ncbi:MAG: RusA family crossover junction endodeoxyribonuclease [Sediminibacterium sp.]|nr:RusA family crossover junction endodeoxyribonuclease [Sediminibacterium sp.]